MKKILSAAKAVVTSMSYYASLQAILMNYDQGKNWCANHYMRFVTFLDPEEGNIKSHFLNDSDIILGGNYITYAQNVFCPLVTTYTVPIEIVKDRGVVEFVKEALDRNRYVSLFVSRADIGAHNGAREPHEIFVFGYDDENGCIHIKDYFEGSAYRSDTCSYGELENAFAHCPDCYTLMENGFAGKIHIRCVGLFEYNREREEEIRLPEIIKNIEDYRNAKDTGGHIRYRHVAHALQNQAYWGIDVYDALQDHARITHKKGLQMDIRAFQFILDHTQALRFTLGRLASTGWIGCEPLYAECEKLEKYQVQIRNKILYFYIRKKISETNIRKFTEKLTAGKALEETFLQSVVKVLSTLRPPQEEKKTAPYGREAV